MQIFLGESLRKVSYRLRAAQLHGQIVNKFHFSCVIFVSLAGGLSFVPCLVCASGSVCLLQDRWKPEKLKKDNAYLHRLIGANIEGYRAIRNAGHKILPDADKEFEGAAWTRKRIPIFSLDLSVCGRNIRGRDFEKSFWDSPFIFVIHSTIPHQTMWGQNCLEWWVRSEYLVHSRGVA